MKAVSIYRSSLSLLIFIALLSSELSAQQTPAFSWSGDTLRVNDKQSIQGYVLKNGTLQPVFAHSCNTPNELQRYVNTGTLQPFIKDSLLSSEVKIDYVAATPRSSGYQQMQITSTYPLGMSRYSLSVYDDCAGVEWQYSVKGEYVNRYRATESREQKAIEDVSLLETEDIYYFYLPLVHPHYRIEVAQFREMTDHNNNLLQESEILPYSKAQLLSGNVLIAQPSAGSGTDVLVKMSPLGRAQSNYFGTDFSVQFDGIRVYSPGFDPDNPDNNDGWYHSYPIFQMRYAESKTEALLAYKRYEQSVHRYLPELDNTFTMNTWGNRSRDSRINAQFIWKELDAAAALGITHYQIDDGWQQGLSQNSSQKAGMLWDDWTVADWQVHDTRFPNGLQPILQKAKEKNLELGLWFNPSKNNQYANWERDRDILVNLHRQLGVSWIKVDGIALGTKLAEERVAAMLAQSSEHTDGRLQFNMDLTAGKRGGYFFLNRVGNIFLENRYTDWGNFYPHLTLRNAWQLSKYVPLQRFQIEWLDKWRNASRYPSEDLLQPLRVPFDYQFAITMMAQPLAWMESTALPPEAFAVKPLIDLWKNERSDMHKGIIHPIGQVPNGFSHTGFVSNSDRRIYVLVFNENSLRQSYEFELPVSSLGRKLTFKKLWGKAELNSYDVEKGSFVVDFSDSFQFLWGYFDAPN